GGGGRAASRANGTGRRGRLTEALDAPAWLRCGGRGRGNVKAGIAVGRRLVEHVVARGGIDALGQAERWRGRACDHGSPRGGTLFLLPGLLRHGGRTKRTRHSSTTLSEELLAAGRRMDTASAEREAGAVGRTRRARCQSRGPQSQGVQPNILWLNREHNTS